MAPGPPGWKRALNGRVAVVFPRFSELALRITIEPELQDEAGYVARAFAPAGIAPETRLCAIEPAPAEIAAAGELAAAADATVLFLFDAHLYQSNRALLEAVQARARALAVVLGASRHSWAATTRRSRPDGPRRRRCFELPSTHRRQRP